MTVEWWRGSGKLVLNLGPQSMLRKGWLGKGQQLPLHLPFLSIDKIRSTMRDIARGGALIAQVTSKR